MPATSWVIRKSKSTVGQIYYFNKSTGDAVWHLSEPELQKVLRRTQQEKQSGSHRDDFPEPAHSPENTSRMDAKETKSKYHKNHHKMLKKNEQAIGNQVTKQFSVDNISNCNGTNPIQFNIPITPTFNGVWNITPKPIYVNPTTISPLQTFCTITQIPEPNTSVPSSSCVNSKPNTQTKKRRKANGLKRNFRPRNYNGKRNNLNEKFQRKNVDMRKAYNHSADSANGFKETYHRETNTTEQNGTCDDNNLVNEDDKWLEINLQSQENRQILDLTVLKRYLQVESSDLWYILVDSNALLNNVNFINIFINLDENCRLILPNIVFDNIKNSRIGTQANRVDYFISKQIEAGLAFIATDESLMNTNEKQSIITCYNKLTQGNCCALILSDDLDSNNIEDDKINAFKISEIKTLLTRTETENVESFNPKQILDDQIKITIPNAMSENNGFYQTYEYESGGEDSIHAQTLGLENETNYMDYRNTPSPDTSFKKDQPGRKKYRSLSSELPDNEDVESQIITENGNSETSSDDKIISNERYIPSKKITKDEIKKNKETSDQKSNEKIIECDNVMFEVTDQKMEDYLRMKSDEWVSRFTQIMEEVLVQILHQEPSFVCDAMPPPWTVYEATECIKRKFYYDSDVQNATIKLLSVLFDLGGLRGKITKDISPKKYMELYSFGVYLIDALQGVLSDSEDLQLAAEYLSKLLKDIQNPHLDECNQDSFVDLHADDEKTCDNSVDNENGFNETENSNHVINDDNSKCKASTSKEDTNVSPTSKQYNLRSIRKKILQDKKEYKDLDSEHSFFSSLELKKNSTDNTGISGENLPNQSKIYQNLSIDNDTTIVRKFTRFKKYEEKLKDKSQLPYDSWTNGNVQEELDYEAYLEDHYSNYNGCMNESDYDEAETEANDKNDMNFDIFVQKLETCVKGTYFRVKKFCNESYQKLSSKASSSEKYDINVLAEKKYAFVEDLCNAFTKLLEREKIDTEYSIQEVFKEYEEVVTKKNIDDYRNLINHLLKHGNSLKDSLKIILDASVLAN